jgi:hypothetical protein
MLYIQPEISLSKINNSSIEEFNALAILTASNKEGLYVTFSK